MQIREYVDLVTQLVNRRVPKCAVDLEINRDNIRYMHPTKGWRRVSFRRIGILPND